MSQKTNVKPPQYLDKAFEQILSDMLTVFINKHKDYGKGNILDTGELGILFRVNDKVKRLQNLISKEQQPKNESVNDTWLDIAVYAVIAILLREGYFKKLELSPDVKEE
jgi:hypothetical protein